MSISSELIFSGIVIGSACLYVAGSKIIIARSSDDDLMREYHRITNLAKKDYRLLRIFPFRVFFNQIIKEIKKRGLE